MLKSHIGEFAALLTAVFWTVTALAFEAAGKRVGSMAVNLIRLIIGLVLLSLFCLINRGMLLPVDATYRMWFWLSISGIIGLAFGDLLLFRAFIVVGARISMLVMALVPPLTATIGWAVMGEVMSFQSLSGMFLTVGGVCLVILERKTGQNQRNLTYPIAGILLAFGGALGQAIGLVLSKYGMGSYNPFAASQIRGIAALASFCIIFTLMGAWNRVGKALKKKIAMAHISLGAFFGPFLGVSFSLLAVQHTTTGSASTIMAIVPVLIIPPAVILFHEKVTFREVAGTIIAFIGVALMFL